MKIYTQLQSFKSLLLVQSIILGAPALFLFLDNNGIKFSLFTLKSTTQTYHDSIIIKKKE